MKMRPRPAPLDVADHTKGDAVIDSYITIWPHVFYDGANLAFREFGVMVFCTLSITSLLTCVMMFVVLSPSHHLQVAEFVVLFVFIPMMNNFMRTKSAFKMTLHDKAMFETVLSVYEYDRIAFPMRESFCLCHSSDYTSNSKNDYVR